MAGFGPAGSGPLAIRAAGPIPPLDKIARHEKIGGRKVCQNRTDNGGWIMRPEADFNPEAWNLTGSLPGLWPQAVLEHISDPVQVIDRDFRIVWCNTFFSGDQEWGPDRLLGRVCHEVFFKRQSPCPDCPLREAFAKGRRVVNEKLIPMADGTHQWRVVYAYPVADSLGETAYVIKIGFDITGRKRDETRLEKYLQNLEDSVSGGDGATFDGPEPVRLAQERFSLTDREIEVLRLLARGFTNANIARLLCISPNTVKTHLGHIFDKLGVGDRARAAVWAARLNIV